MGKQTTTAKVFSTAFWPFLTSPLKMTGVSAPLCLTQKEVRPLFLCFLRIDSLQTDANVNVPRFIYDNAFFLSLMIIMINIVSGIIIDTFGSIREEDKKYNEDVNNTCFICGYDRETLDKAFEQKYGFKIHTTVDFWDLFWHFGMVCWASSKSTISGSTCIILRTFWTNPGLSTLGLRATFLRS